MGQALYYSKKIPCDNKYYEETIGSKFLVYFLMQVSATLQTFMEEKSFD